MRQNREGGASPGYVWRTHARESMFGCLEKHCRKGLYGENIEERVCLKKTFEREYVWRRHGRESMYEGNMRKNMYVENVEERECLEKTLKHLREGMLGGSMEENVCFGENMGERVCLEKTLERGYVWRKYMYWREDR